MTLTAVIPSRNRSETVTAKVRWVLAQPGVDEVVIVADGCTDDTVESLRSIDDPRLVVVVNTTSIGPPLARIRGAEAASSEWLLMLDDDDHHAAGFVQTLLDVAAVHQADAVGTPWLPPDPMDIDERVRIGRAHPHLPRIDRYDWFPPADIRSPWLNNNHLIRREVFLASDYGHDAFPYNHFREESDHFLGLWAAGKTLILTPSTYSWMPVQISGGVNKTSRLKYEGWVLRNHWTFLKRQREPLQSIGAIGRSLPVAWLHYAAERITLLGRLWLKARLGRS